MRRIMIAVALSCAALATAACTQGASNASNVDGSRPRFFATQLVVDGWTDPKNGCEYLYFSANEKGGDVTPRYGADGKQQGCR